MSRDAFATVEFGLPFGKVGYHLLDERVMFGVKRRSVLSRLNSAGHSEHPYSLTPSQSALLRTANMFRSPVCARRRVEAHGSFVRSIAGQVEVAAVAAARRVDRHCHEDHRYEHER